MWHALTDRYAEGHILHVYLLSFAHVDHLSGQSRQHMFSMCNCPD